MSSFLKVDSAALSAVNEEQRVNSKELELFGREDGEKYQTYDSAEFRVKKRRLLHLTLRQVASTAGQLPLGVQ